eukprot:358126-Chlamydomonas_euryale.AAC.6
MLGHGLGTPAFERRGAKEALKHLFARIRQRAYGSVLLYGLRTCLKKGCLNPMCHTTAVPTLIIAHPTCRKVSAACPGSTRCDQLLAGPRGDL